MDNSETDPCFLRNMLVNRSKGLSFFKWGVVNLFTYLVGESMQKIDPPIIIIIIICFSAAMRKETAAYTYSFCTYKP